MEGRKNGEQKYRVRINYTDRTGNPKQIDRVVYGKEKAKQMERELNYKIKEEAPSAKITLQKLYEEYISAKKSEVRESSLDKTSRVLMCYVLGTAENSKIKALRNARVDKLTMPLLQTWKQDITNLGLKHKTKQNIFSEFRALLNFAVKMEYIPSNPLIKIGNFRATMEAPHSMDYYTPEEFKRFIAAAKGCAEVAARQKQYAEQHFYVFFCIAFYTGMRKGEINALQWTDINDGILSVTKSITQKLKGEDRITPPKNKTSVRTLQLPKPLIDILDEHYALCRDTIADFNDGMKICGGVKALRDTSIQKHNVKYSELAGIKTIRIHDFRHSHASLLANEGINIQEVARRLGHSDISMTWNTYAHLYPREEERAISILNKIV
jgi:integrase